MNKQISMSVVGHATSIFLALTYVLCIGFDLVFPGHAMYEAWQKLLPGFEWLTLMGFLIGLIESYAYGWYFALIWVSLYNFFAKRAKA